MSMRKLMVALALAAGLDAGGGRARAHDAADLEGPAAASGPESAAGEELEQLIEEALRRNPDLLVLDEEIEAARARPEQARSLPDPMVSVVYRNDGWSPSLGEQMMTNLAFMGSQALPWPGKRSLRGEIAKRGIELSIERRERGRLGLAADVRRAYWDLVLARETLVLLREQEEVWREAEGVARARYTVGQGAQQDVLRALVEITRFEQLRAEQEGEAEARRAELDRLVGRGPDDPVRAGGRLALVPEPRGLEALLAEAETRSPELRAFAAAAEREGLAVDLARKEFRPDFAVQAGYMNRGGLDPMWQAGVGVTLPVRRSRLRAGLAEAEARRRAAARQIEAARAQLRFRTRERFAALRAAETGARLYAAGLIPQAQLSYEAALANYQAGRVPFLSVLEALSTLYGDRVAHLRLLAGHERIKAALEEAGLEAAPGMPVVGSGMGPAGPAAMGGSGPVGVGPGSDLAAGTED